MKISGAAVVSIACIPVTGAFVARSGPSSVANTIQLNLHHGDNQSRNVDTHRNEWFGRVAAAVAGLTIASQAAMADQSFMATSFPPLADATTPVILQQQQGKSRF